eukprot:629343_1
MEHKEQATIATSAQQGQSSQNGATCGADHETTGADHETTGTADDESFTCWNCYRLFTMISSIIWVIFLLLSVFYTNKISSTKLLAMNPFHHTLNQHLLVILAN